MIRGVVDRADLEKGFGFMREMERGGVSPTVVTYNTLIDACCKRRKVKEAMVLLREMAARGVVANLISYNSVINGLFGEGRMSEVGEIGRAHV